MAKNKRISYIPSKPPVREKRVGIYCRVSTNSVEQLKSITAQVSVFKLFEIINLTNKELEIIMDSSFTPVIWPEDKAPKEAVDYQQCLEVSCRLSCL